ncbi:NAD(+) diphosphatase [Clostridium sp. CM028]|uniref:NAD(+) diphosphatase n=1 Tax=Clostridium TaxID=1485 RepID=UPI0013EEC027|nr:MULTISPECIES: NAD(+) diphosphatase [Clostridium]MBU3091992.1 NAD(+) diphosphatase [Clostridium sp. CF011]MBW9145637.1 NAD(+) diphosphatase [Clostridium sp. CM027]MBW9149487.1 NAD(+) diphosphatase [Clostridium sp. CM028]MBZ9608017.1 NAD(+) diphosphatase [Clostridium estertheticum]UVE41509.1 NAD(+) diphosphatase [Clostridium sp. CM027]
MHNDKIISTFIPSVASILPETNNDIYFLFYKDELLVKSDANKTTIPTIRDLVDLKLNNIQYLGSINGENCFCGEMNKDAIIPNSMCLLDLKSLTHQLPNEMFWIAGRAKQIVSFNNDHKYCGRCGTLTQSVGGERSKKCSKCGLVNYPRICPAIIVAVVKDGKLLLAHNNQFPKDLYSVVSGFVEVGETFEECVVREVCEETGITVKNIKYFGNQPWPFPNSLMIGFTCEYESGEIQVDGKEIGHAKWYSSTELPLTPDSISIAKKLIDWFTENN